jgi:hypothetical protein
MNTNRAINVRSRSSVIFYSALAVAALFLIVSQVIQSVVIPASGTVPSPALIAIGSTMTFLAVLSTLAMVYSMLLRRRGE